MAQPVNFRLRLALQQTLSFTGLLLLFAWVFYGIALHTVQREFDDRVFDRSAVIHSMMSDRDGEASLLDPSTNLQGNDALKYAFYQVLDSHGNVLAASGDPQLAGIPVTDVAKATVTANRTTWETVTLPNSGRARIVNRVVSDSIHNQSFLLRVAMSTQQAEERVHQYLLLLLVCLPVIVLIDALTVWRMTRKATAPVAWLISATKDIGGSDPKRRFASADKTKDMQTLTTVLNEMVERLEGNSRHLRELLPNLSHEIRNPLANLRAEAEFALRQARTVDDYREVLAHQVTTVDMITATVSDLMQLARYGSQPIKPNKQDQSISELLQAAVDSMLPVANLNKVHLTANVCEGIHGEVDTFQICRVLQNLIDNAIKYNRKGGHVHVLVEQRRTSTAIQISDTGMGIASADLNLIFDRAYRSVKARASHVQGSGLGLYFAKMVVEAHQGQISVESIEDQGTSFFITLPGSRIVGAETRDTAAGAGQANKYGFELRSSHSA